VGLTQDFTGQIEPDDPAWDRATGALRKRYYDAAGKKVLKRLEKQLGRGIGANGQRMRPRKQAVLPDGADGPVMIPHYLRSRAITLADYSATERGLKMWWHGGTGHRSFRSARKRFKAGKRTTDAKPFGEILQYHADGEVPHAPVRDVRLSKANIAQIKREMAPEWRAMAKRVKPAPRPVPPKPPGPTAPTPPTGPAPPAAPTPPTLPTTPRGGHPPHPVPPAPHVPVPAPVPPRRRRRGEPLPPSEIPGGHPTPTHPIPVYRSLPKGRIKGPIFVVTGGGSGTKGKIAPKPAPKAPGIAKAAPVPKPAPRPKVTVGATAGTPGPAKGPVVRAPAPAPPKPPPPAPPPPPVETPSQLAARRKLEAIAAAVLHGHAQGFEVQVDAAAFTTAFGAKAKSVIAFYSAKKDQQGLPAIFINPDHTAWADPATYFAKYDVGRARPWFAGSHPLYAMDHELGHGHHARAMGLQAFRDFDDRFLDPLEVATALRVSSYAATNKAEFVAEVYAASKGGKQFDPGVLALYNQLGGPSLG
jgi:hypothetical protein